MAAETPSYRVLSHKTIVLWAVLIVAIGAGFAVWLLLAYGRADPLGAIRTAGTVVIGSGGAAALLLAARRQRSAEIALVQKDRDQADVARTHALQEQVAAESRADAAERRITELYTKAVEQLGSDKAPVRLGGLYALERLAQDHKSQRQTIVNVLCAYLRMPHRLDEPEDGDSLTKDAHRQEREVRRTAQHLITAHVRTGSTKFWEDMSIDLTGALLINFVMIDGQFGWASFKAATFAGPTMFLDTSFPQYADFTEAMFLDDTHFTTAKFTGDARFENTTFKSSVTFGGIMKGQVAAFAKAATFRGATFEGPTEFGGAAFHGPAYFHESRTGRHTSFAGRASFGRARFASSAYFSNATFAAAADFTNVTFDAKPQPDIPTLEPVTEFRSATFANGVPPEIEPFRKPRWGAR